MWRIPGKNHDLPPFEAYLWLIQFSQGGHLACIPETAKKRPESEGTVNSNPRGRWLIYAGDTFPVHARFFPGEGWKKGLLAPFAWSRRGAKRLAERPFSSSGCSRVKKQTLVPLYSRLKRRPWREVEEKRNVEETRKEEGAPVERWKYIERGRMKEKKKGNHAVNHPAFAWPVRDGQTDLTWTCNGRTKRNRDPACR